MILAAVLLLFGMAIQMQINGRSLTVDTAQLEARR
jgi:hypothetical protein